MRTVKPKPGKFLLAGTVVRFLGSERYIVLLDGTERQIMAYLAGKLRHSNIRIWLQDRVVVEADAANPAGQARLVWRY